jgi:ABC-type antimicrobial peptide transport system permease subunit
MGTGATLFSVFGGVALLLAMIGLYGIRSYTLARRTREIGIRMALGANAGDTLRLVVREGAALTAIGAAAGLTLSFLLGKVLAGILVSGERLRPRRFPDSARRIERSFAGRLLRPGPPRRPRRPHDRPPLRIGWGICPGVRLSRFRFTKLVNHANVVFLSKHSHTALLWVFVKSLRVNPVQGITTIILPGLR